MKQVSNRTTIRIGTAGWSIPREHAGFFPAKGSHLARYSTVFSCTEINSSFYRPHRPSTYARWAASTPANFRFAVKLAKSITHACVLSPSRQEVQRLLDPIRHLGEKLGPILIQLPPRHTFEEHIARGFLGLFRDLYPSGHVTLEPRHPTWFSSQAGDVLQEFEIGRVVADPPPTPAAVNLGGYAGLLYHRLHGSPHVYYSSYSTAQLDELSCCLANQMLASEVWCIFDNTASGAAVPNAYTLANLWSLRLGVARNVSLHGRWHRRERFFGYRDPRLQRSAPAALYSL